VKAKRVIFLCMAGGPSQLETFDWKPLKDLHDKPFPESFTKGQQLAQLQNVRVEGARIRSRRFKNTGRRGIEISDLFPHIASVADELCVIRSMQTEQINHDTAHAFMNTGSHHQGPAQHGLVAARMDSARRRRNCRASSCSPPPGKFGQQPISARQWSSGVLPSRFQGIQFQSKGDAVHYIGNPDGVCQSTQRQVVEEINSASTASSAKSSTIPRSPRASPSMKWRSKCRSSVPDLTDSSATSQEMLDLYGVKEPGDGSFASNCLLARRLAERGVRMIQLYHRAWDHHGARGRHEVGRDGPSIRPRPPSSRISKQRGCSTTRSSSGAGNSDARRWGRAPGAITTFFPSASSWPAAA
jgi:hypothetical protein